MYNEIRSAVAAEFTAVDQFIIEQLHSNVSLVESIGHYIVEAGGKRLRPILVLLAAKACNIESTRHIPMAAVIEFIHTATLLHDDVVDMSDLRRGRPTVNAEWNNPSSVLVGDFIYSRAFQILVEIGDMQIMEIIADTTNRIAEGEVLQLINKSNPQPTEAGYMEVIKSKTAILFEAAGRCAAILAEADPAIQSALQRYGMHLGTAFQLIDDVLDYAGDASELGKNVGDDLAEGKPTLPLIFALENASEAQTQLIRDSLTCEKIDAEALQSVFAIVQESGALEYTKNLARKEADLAQEALQALPENEYRARLQDMVEFSINRSS